MKQQVGFISVREGVQKFKNGPHSTDELVGHIMREANDPELKDNVDVDYDEVMTVLSALVNYFS